MRILGISTNWRASSTLPLLVSTAAARHTMRPAQRGGASSAGAGAKRGRQSHSTAQTRLLRGLRSARTCRLDAEALVAQAAPARGEVQGLLRQKVGLCSAAGRGGALAGRRPSQRVQSRQAEAVARAKPVPGCRGVATYAAGENSQPKCKTHASLAKTLVAVIPAPRWRRQEGRRGQEENICEANLTTVTACNVSFRTP
eukprot:scaffold29843_cov63-Phaeocystis_antarctica.AAC.11